MNHCFFLPDMNNRKWGQSSSDTYEWDSETTYHASNTWQWTTQSLVDNAVVDNRGCQPDRMSLRPVDPHPDHTPVHLRGSSGHRQELARLPCQHNCHDDGPAVVWVLISGWQVLPKHSVLFRGSNVDHKRSDELLAEGIPPSTGRGSDSEADSEILLVRMSHDTPEWHCDLRLQRGKKFHSWTGEDGVSSWQVIYFNTVYGR